LFEFLTPLFLNRATYNCKIKTNKNIEKLTNIRVKIMATDSQGSIWIALFVLKPAKYVNYIIPYFRNVVTDELNFFQNPKLDAYNLSTKKLETINMLSSGLSNVDIADKLDVTEGCVKKRISELKIDFKVETKPELMKAISGLVRL